MKRNNGSKNHADGRKDTQNIMRRTLICEVSNKAWTQGQSKAASLGWVMFPNDAPLQNGIVISPKRNVFGQIYKAIQL